MEIATSVALTEAGDLGASIAGTPGASNAPGWWGGCVLSEKTTHIDNIYTHFKDK